MREIQATGLLFVYSFDDQNLSHTVHSNFDLTSHILVYSPIFKH